MQVKWPKFITDLMLLTENVNFSVMTLPGLSCILRGTSYKMKLLSYTIGPLFLYFMIMLPCMLANIIFSRKTLSESPWKARYQAAQKAMMNNICFFSFLIYPMVSMVVLKGLHCKDFGPLVGSVLITDVSIVCPYAENGDRFLYWYTLGFVLVYPLGLPVFLWLLLKAYRVPQMAQRKILESGLAVMIQMYMDETCATPLKRLAAILWSEEKMLTYFQLLCNDHGRIVLKDLQQKSPNDRNRKFRELFVAVFTHLEVTEDMDYHKFFMLVEKLQQKVSQAAKEFQGPVTTMDLLTSAQLRLLIKHEFKCDRGEIEAEEFSFKNALDQNMQSSDPKSGENEAEDVFRAMEGGGNDDNAPEDPNAPHNQYQSFKDFKVAMTAVTEPARGKKKRLSKKERNKLGDKERADELEKAELREELAQRIFKLVKNGVLALPPMAWDGKDEDEQRAVAEIGSLFKAYRPTSWKFELFETFRKLIMVAMLLFIFEGKPLQVAFGFIVTFIVIMYVQQLQPYSTNQLNKMAVVSFIGQLATLFYGLLAMANKGERDRDPEAYDNGIEQVLMRYLVAAINCFVVFLPFLEMEWLAAIPLAFIGFLICCVAPLLHYLGLKKKDAEEHEIEPDSAIYNSDDELDAMASDDPYHAAFSALRSKEARRLFDKYDTDCTGTLSSEELFQSLSRCGYRGERIFEIMGNIDQDQSEDVSYTEWHENFVGTAKQPTYSTNSADPRAPRESSPGVNVRHPVMANPIQDTQGRNMDAMPVGEHDTLFSQVWHRIETNIEKREATSALQQLRSKQDSADQRLSLIQADLEQAREKEVELAAALLKERGAKHLPPLDVATMSRLPQAMGQYALGSIAAGAMSQFSVARNSSADGKAVLQAVVQQRKEVEAKIERVEAELGVLRASAAANTDDSEEFSGVETHNSTLLLAMNRGYNLKYS